MSFWDTQYGLWNKTVDDILSREEFTLEDLLNESETLQEVKVQNKKLMKYLAQPAVLTKLFEYVAVNPPEGANLEQHFKYSFAACEILHMDEDYLTGAVFQNESQTLALLFSFLDQPAPLNPRVAGSINIVVQTLWSKRGLQMLEYLKKKQGAIGKFINHLGCGPITELFLAIFGSDEFVENASTHKWLCDENLATGLLNQLEPSLPEDVHENVGQVLAEVIRITTKIPTSPLLAQFESDSFVEKLFEYIFANNSVLLNGLPVVIELLHRHAHDATDESPAPPLLLTCAKYVERFSQILQTHADNVIVTPAGSVRPLGFHRLKVVEFFLALIQTRHRHLDEQLIKAGTLRIILDLFFEYKLNNFLHATVAQIILTIIDGNSDELKHDLLVTSGLLDRIIEATKTTDSTKPRDSHLANLGFLDTVSLSIVAITPSNKKIAEVLELKPEWKNYFNEATLKEVSARWTKPLGSISAEERNLAHVHGLSSEVPKIE